MKILISSLAKSGTNYLSGVFDDLGYKESSAGFSYQSICSNFYLLRLMVRGGGVSKSPLLVGYDFKVPFSPKWIETKILGIGEQEYLTCHCNYTDQFYSMVKTNNVQVIKLVRHPKDVLVSYKEYVCKTKNNPFNKAFNKMSDADIWRLLVEGGEVEGVYFSSLREKLLSVDEWFNFDRAVVVKYEELICPVDDATGRVADSIKLLSDSIGVKNEDFTASLRTMYGNSHTFNKGGAGRYKEILPSVVNEKIDFFCGDIIRRWGYD